MRQKSIRATKQLRRASQSTGRQLRQSRHRNDAVSSERRLVLDNQDATGSLCRCQQAVPIEGLDVPKTENFSRDTRSRELHSRIHCQLNGPPGRHQSQISAGAQYARLFHIVGFTNQALLGEQGTILQNERGNGPCERSEQLPIGFRGRRRHRDRKIRNVAIPGGRNLGPHRPMARPAQDGRTDDHRTGQLAAGGVTHLCGRMHDGTKGHRGDVRIGDLEQTHPALHRRPDRHANHRTLADRTVTHALRAKTLGQAFRHAQYAEAADVLTHDETLGMGAHPVEQRLCNGGLVSVAAWCGVGHEVFDSGWLRARA